MVSRIPNLEFSQNSAQHRRGRTKNFPIDTSQLINTSKTSDINGAIISNEIVLVKPCSEQQLKRIYFHNRNFGRYKVVLAFKCSLRLLGVANASLLWRLGSNMTAFTHPASFVSLLACVFGR